MADKATGSKSKKVLATSPVGRQMEGLTETLKLHKADKSMHECLTNMHGSIKSPIMKTAYEAGYKYATDSVSENSSTDNPASTQSEDEGEKVIRTLRRGWPDVLEKAEREHDGPDSRDEYSSDNFDQGQAKERSRMTKYSPETTV